MLDTVIRREPEVVAFEITDSEVATEGFDGSVVPGVIDVVVFPNICLMSTKVVGIDLEDIDNEGLSDIPKIGRIPDLELDDIAITSPDTRPIWEAVNADQDPGTRYGVSVSIFLGVGTRVVVKIGN